MPTASEIVEIVSKPKVRVVKSSAAQRFFRKAPARIGSAFSRSDSFFSNVGNRFVKERKKQLVYAQGIRRPLIGSGNKKYGGGRGRPKGPSGKYYIPGQGAVGVYEYRMWLRSTLRNKRQELQRNMTMSPEQRQALAELQARQRNSQANPENRVIVDTQGRVPLRTIHQEADDYANLIP
jgi:hypothetical protein